MSRRYDGRTTTFSPEGRLYQVEYAMEAISHAGAALGIVGKDGIVLAAEKKITSKLLDNKDKTEKMFRLDKHIACAVAGITADANILINSARINAQRYQFMFQEPIPVEQLVKTSCDAKQSYTQFGGMRPFGVSFLYIGWDDKFGYQLYHSDPSGNYGGWRATAIGANNQGAQSILKQEWSEDLTLQGAKKLAVKVLTKTMDSTSLSSEKLEFVSLSRDEDADEIEYKVLPHKEVDDLLKEAQEEREREQQRKEQQKQRQQRS